MNIRTNTKNFIFTQYPMTESNELVYLDKASKALKSDSIASDIVDFNNDGYYTDYMDAANKNIGYSILSLISLFHQYGIEPIDIMEGNNDYHIYIKVDKYLINNYNQHITNLENKIMDIIDEKKVLTGKLQNLFELFSGYDVHDPELKAYTKKTIAAILKPYKKKK